MTVPLPVVPGNGLELLKTFCTEGTLPPEVLELFRPRSIVDALSEGLPGSSNLGGRGGCSVVIVLNVVRLLLARLVTVFVLEARDPVSDV